MRATALACLVAAGCHPATTQPKTAKVSLPPMRVDPAPELSPPGLPAVIVAELAAPEREVRFARNGDHALLATRAGGQWVVGPVRVDRDDETALSPGQGHGGMRPVQAAPENTPAALHRHGSGFLLAWVEHLAGGEERVMALALDAMGSPAGAVRLVGRSTQTIDWVDVLGDGGQTFVVWDAQRGATRSVELAALTSDGVSPSTVLDGGRGWHAVAAGASLWFASVGDGPKGAVAVDRLTYQGGKLTVAHTAVSSGRSALGDVQVAALENEALLAWSDRKDGDLHVFTSTVSLTGVAAEPQAIDRVGASAMVGLTASGDRKRALVAWERVSTTTAARRVLELSTYGAHGARLDARGEAIFASQTDTPQLFGDGSGFGLLTLAPVKLTSDATISDAPSGPTFVRLDGELRVRSSEPLRVRDFADAEPMPGLPLFVQSAECEGDRCTVVARGAGSPSLLALVKAPVRDHGWLPAARRLPPPEPPMAEKLATLFELDHPVADFAAEELADGRTLLAWVERVPAANVTEKSGGKLQIRFVEKDGHLGEVITISEKAVPVGGIDLEALPAGGDAVAALAWVGPVQGPQFFVTRIGPRGEKVLQKTVTKIARTATVAKDGAPGRANEVVDVELVKDERGGLFCAWSDTRTGDPEIFLARIDAHLDRRGSELQLTSTKGASTEPRLLVTGPKTLVAWSETPDGAEQGEIDLASFETTTMKLVDRGRELAASPGHSRSPSFSGAPSGAALVWLEEPVRRGTATSSDGVATEDRIPGLRLAALDADGQPSTQVKRIDLAADAPISAALRCEDGACRALTVALDGSEFRFDAITTPWSSAAAARRSPIAQLGGGTLSDVRVHLAPNASRAYFVEERDGRTRVRQLDVRWTR